MRELFGTVFLYIYIGGRGASWVAEDLRMTLFLHIFADEFTGNFR